MHLIFNAADLERNDPVVAGDTAQVRPDARLKVWRNPALTILRAEGNVVLEASVGIRHRSR
jgi:hypothetical protein